MHVHHASLSNGLEIIAELSEEAQTAAVGFFVKTGSRDESRAVAGVSHFLEHMVFKGTRTRDGLQVNRELDMAGAKHNAQTSEEDTIYYLACLPEYLDASFDVLADILRPELRETDFETERQVILEEIQMYLDQPMSVAYEAARPLHFGAHPLGQSVLGTRESIESLRLADMRSYFTSRYGPSNIVLAVSGRTEWDHVLRLAEGRCGSWTGPLATRPVTPPRGSRAFRSIHRPEDLQQLFFGMSDGPPLESRDRYAAQLLAMILGDHTGSRLYWELIEPGRADTAELSFQDYNGAGLFFTVISCEPEIAAENLGRLEETLRGAEATGFSSEELASAKNKVMARAVVQGERPMGRLWSLGFHWTYRREYMSLDQELDQLAAVTLEDLERLLAEWPLWPQTIVTVGPSTSIDAPSRS